MAVKKDDKTGKWMYYGSYVDEKENRIQYKKRGFSGKREAQRAELAFRDEINNRSAHLTFSDVVKEYLPRAGKELKESSYADTICIYNKVESSIGDILITKLDTRTLQNYIDSLDKSFSKSYVEKIYYRINKIFDFAINNGYMDKNPMKRVKVDSRKNEVKKEMLFWEPNEFALFIKNVDSQMYQTLFSFLYYMGTRKGEALAITWKDIDFEHNTVHIDKSVALGFNNKITTPKTSNSIRNITMPKKLSDMMKKWKNYQQTLYDFDDSLLVFGYTRTLPAESLRRNFKKYIAKTNNLLKEDEKIKDIRIHDLRHSHASYLINNMSSGFTDFDIAKRLGDTVSTLHSTYAHWFKSADKGIIDFMDKDIADA